MLHNPRADRIPLAAVRSGLREQIVILTFILKSQVIISRTSGYRDNMRAALVAGCKQATMVGALLLLSQIYGGWVFSKQLSGHMVKSKSTANNGTSMACSRHLACSLQSIRNELDSFQSFEVKCAVESNPLNRIFNETARHVECTEIKYLFLKQK